MNNREESSSDESEASLASNSSIIKDTVVEELASLQRRIQESRIKGRAGGKKTK